jgi:hypothetical protein
MRDRELMASGVVLTAGGVAVLIAAFLPSLYPVWTARAVDAVGIIAQHRGIWRLANVLFAVGAGLTLAGLAALTGRLSGGPTTTVALTLMALASVLWLANLAFRLTVTMRVAGAVADGGTVPDWYEDVNAWTGGLWSVAALAGALATVCYGLAIVGAGPVGALPAWTGWLALGIGALMLVLFLVTRDVPPFLLYLAPTAFGVAALIRA